MRVFLVGGGTGGATAPVLAVGEALLQLHPATKLFLVGNQGIEQKMVDKSKLPLVYLSIPAGKWRRYFSLMNFFDVFKTIFGFFKSLRLISEYQPDMIFGAGSFVQVPLAYAAYVKRVPVIIHQPDFDLLLSTRLVAPVAKAVTVSFAASERSLPEFSGLLRRIEKSKVTVTGNPVRKEIFGGSKDKARKTFGLNKDYPVLLVIGGSQGAARLNEVILAAASELVKYVQIIHITGSKRAGKQFYNHPHYHGYEYIGTDLRDAYAAADLVISRGGISTITELSALAKPAIVVPLPKSPQETNAEILAFTRSAVVVFEEFLTEKLIVNLVRKVMWNQNAVQTIKDNIKKLLPRNADRKIAKLILDFHDNTP
ncbi:MAG: hypothetical protein A3C85_00560 [Candidatus Doudnabacteria bacterium RIFCSPHIGHO2_02_FULL_48_21]|uniref:UDP-N-acetylglucosamine--N-acetylmuramyl-(pentapeptide) pyrophosphoryl-undecaprenol N-acetylglucosamine transferase n=1 Tax=Candidatus Doudnabacteria bacterium RIFCSPLOWO2_02_FULL_48_13 TaxID=1817845 RepID=A0A1F5Q897_9BACT|nr:MAG: hypothetical protein A3K05_04900 [Candidatus Doudnabacteria bacterium RIFCSPHIGHO2_01_48_18]OGE77139.1 MAG: hypothetical protein A2668_03940 [Candidatus Doudnabacteria bacterium RIFCSPHIGHO2_01_FULL_48_180]OGE91588.1 MAG: hypothetical protein A3F44_04440 [Candidatus Doudnabacteria bacterium RIFCSPHIGHO2_12_FULL_47_25]OGE93851.1 MAG: hypothetical protein A3C85_00560 [Candidatus Doudnabacteria bacterium RIFCSPHIGHO2_02_FULL_48_21]OGE97646.1 MAG: hypothetical protein A3A83_04525 [Candidatu